MAHKIIEFVGTAGSGKSTLSNFLAESLISEGYRVYNFSYEIGKKNRLCRIYKKALKITFFILKNSLISYKCIQYIIESKQHSTKDIIITFFNIIYILGVYSNVQPSRYDFTIFDQGIIQALWSIMISSKNEMVIKKLSPIIPENDCICHVIVDKDIIHKRINNRSGAQSRIERLPKPLQLDAIIKADTTLRHILFLINLSPITIFNNRIDQIKENILIIRSHIL